MKSLLALSFHSGIHGFGDKVPLPVGIAVIIAIVVGFIWIYRWINYD
jgi:tellurite resistance protein TehA-like permease